MALTFTDRIVQYPNRYNMTLVSGTTYDLTPVPGTITQQGTALNASNLNQLGSDMMNTFIANRGTELIYSLNNIQTKLVTLNNIDMDKYSYVEIKAVSYRSGVGPMTTFLKLNGTSVYSDYGNSNMYVGINCIIDRTGIVKHSEKLMANYYSDLADPYEPTKEWYLYTKNISLISDKYYTIEVGADVIGGGCVYLSVIGYK